MSFFRFFLIILPIILLGCASSPDTQKTEVKTETASETVKSAGKNTAKADRDSIDPDVLFMLLTAELAGQRGQYEIALEGYMEAAKRVHDPKISERAAMIAMYMKNGNKTDEAVSMWLKRDPGNLDARKIAVYSALKSGDKKASVEQFSQLLNRDPADFEKTVFELVEALQKEQNLSFFYEVLEDLSVKHPNQAAIYLAQSVLAADMKDMVLAQRKIDQTLALQPDWDRALILQAQMAAYAHDYVKAETLLRDGSAKYPDNEKFKKMLAQVLIKAEKFEEAGEVYQALVDKDAKDYESLFALGLVYMELERDSKAEDIFTQLLDQTEWRNQSAFYLGKLEEKRGEIDKALAWFEKISEGPFQFEAGVTGVGMLAKAKRFREAEQRLDALSANFPKQKGRLILVKAELFSQQKQYDRAFALLTDELNKSPDQEDLLYSRSLMAERLNKLDVMEADLKKILVKNPDNAEALNALGYSLADKTARYLEAEKYLVHALRIKPNEAVIIDSYGWLKYKMGDLAKAEQLLRQAYDKQPENEIAAHLAEVLWVSGKRDEAKKVFYEAIEKSPEDSYLLGFKKKFLQAEGNS